MNSNTFSAAESIHDAQRLIHRGEFPEEWVDTETIINDREDAPFWAKDIISNAKVQLALFLLPEEMQLTILADETIDEIKENCTNFVMKKHSYRLTQTMHQAGWKQYQSVVSTKSRKLAEEEGVKYKRYRYPVHFWVAPEGQIVLGKLKLEGKYVPRAD